MSHVLFIFSNTLFELYLAFGLFKKLFLIKCTHLISINMFIFINVIYHLI